MTQQELDNRLLEVIMLPNYLLTPDYQRLMSDAQTEVLSHQGTILSLAEQLFYTRDNTCPNINVIFQKECPGGYTALEQSQTLINLNRDVWLKLPVAISLLAHEYIHALRPHVAGNRANYLEEGMARWFENNYMLHAGFDVVNYGGANDDPYLVAERLYIEARPVINVALTNHFNGNSTMKLSALNLGLLQGWGLTDINLCNSLLNPFL